MKITDNEKFVLKLMLEDPEINNVEIGEKLNLTSQAIGKIRKQLSLKGLIKNNELTLDYEKFGIGLHAIALIRVHPSALKKNKINELKKKVLKPINAIRSYALPQTDVTHIIIYAFKDIKEYDHYFKQIQIDFGEFVEIKDSYVFSSGSILKSSSRDLFLKIVNDLGKENEK